MRRSALPLLPVPALQSHLHRIANPDITPVIPSNSHYGGQSRSHVTCTWNLILSADLTKQLLQIVVRRLVDHLALLLTLSDGASLPNQPIQQSLMPGRFLPVEGVRNIHKPTSGHLRQLMQVFATCTTFFLLMGVFLPHQFCRRV